MRGSLPLGRNNLAIHLFRYTVSTGVRRVFVDLDRDCLTPIIRIRFVSNLHLASGAVSALKIQFSRIVGTAGSFIYNLYLTRRPLLPSTWPLTLPLTPSSSEF